MADKKPKRNARSSIPQEYGDVGQETIDHVNARIDKCYSSEDYEGFQKAVEDIAGRYIGAEDGRDKVKAHAREVIKEHISGDGKKEIVSIARESAKELMADEGWKQKTFWIPVGVSIIATAVAIVAIFKK